MDLGSQRGRDQSFSSTSTLRFLNCDGARQRTSSTTPQSRGRCCDTSPRTTRSGTGGVALSLLHLRELRLPHVPLLALRPTLASTHHAPTAGSQAIAVATPTAELTATPSAAASTNERRRTSTRTRWRGLRQAQLRWTTRPSAVTRCSGKPVARSRRMASGSLS
jgi:hypothetical protein